MAIKIIDLEEAEDDILTIRREILALTEGQVCPQLVRYKGSIVDGSNLWIVMELVVGGSILDKVYCVFSLIAFFVTGILIFRNLLHKTGQRKPP